MAEDRDDATIPQSPSGATWAVLGAASREMADAFLAEQTDVARLQKKVLALQAEDLKREDDLRHWSLRVRHISDVLKLGFELAAACILTAIVLFIAGAVWSAANDHGLVIEAFDVPADYAERGLTGKMLAGGLLERLTALQNATVSARPAASYQNNWGDDIKVQIPNTGISIGEFDRYLRGWLGHQTRITGELYRTANGIAVTAHVGDQSETVEGHEADLDRLLQLSAENIYRRTQPYRYAAYFESKTPPNFPLAEKLFESLSTQGPPLDRAWAYNGLTLMDEHYGDYKTAIADERAAIALVPDFTIAFDHFVVDEQSLGHDEGSLVAGRRFIALLKRNDDINEIARAHDLPDAQLVVDLALGDVAAARTDSETLVALPDWNGALEDGRGGLVLSFAMSHDGAAARRALLGLSPTSDPLTLESRAGTDLQTSYWLGNWSAVVDDRANLEHAAASVAKAFGLPPSSQSAFVAIQAWPFVAAAMAEMGKLRAAHALIDETPADCYICLRSRGTVDAVEMKWDGAAWWFARAVSQAPSIPFAYTDWGATLLAKGEYDGAIEKFQTANQKGPHFADPLEMWGEALIAKNRSDLALAKFADADKYAPNWGRLHLKWGEALFWSGDRSGAEKQFAVATGLDLSARDKAALARDVRTVHV